MIQLAYASAATRPFSTQELSELLRKARENNEARGITGLLVHHAGSFFQVLEGEDQIVDEVFHNIKQDPRHDRVMQVMRCEIEERDFKQWRMGFYEANARDLLQMKGFSEFFQKGFERRPGSVDASRARQLLLAFRDGKWHQNVQT